MLVLCPRNDCLHSAPSTPSPNRAWPTCSDPHRLRLPSSPPSAASLAKKSSSWGVREPERERGLGPGQSPECTLSLCGKWPGGTGIEISPDRNRSIVLCRGWSRRDGYTGDGAWARRCPLFRIPGCRNAFDETYSTRTIIPNLDLALQEAPSLPWRPSAEQRLQSRGSPSAGGSFGVSMGDGKRREQYQRPRREGGEESQCGIAPPGHDHA